VHEHAIAPLHVGVEEQAQGRDASCIATSVTDWLALDCPRMTKPAGILLLLAYLAFISLGLPDTVLGVAWPSLRAGFGISQSAMGAVLAAGMSGYFLSGLTAGSLMGKLGVGGLLTLSSGLVTLALLGYALAPAWSSFFPIGVLMGLGSGAIDAGLNGYASRHLSVRHVNWLHACWGVGASTGPLIMTGAIARGFGYRTGYAVLGGLLGLMTLAFLLTRRLWDEPAAPAQRSGAMAADVAAIPVAAGSQARIEPEPVPASFGGALRNGRVWLLMATFFLYTGLESSVGQWCFSVLREGRGHSVEVAGFWTAAYWASLTLGRILLGFIVDRLGPDRLLRWASLGALSGVLLFVTSQGVTGRLGLLLIGASLAPVFPTLMARTPGRLGADVARHAVGFQVSAATLGSALLPALVGLLVARLGLGAVSAVTLGLGLAFLVVHEWLLRVTAALALAPDAPRAEVR
jgi:fucose permease